VRLPSGIILWNELLGWGTSWQLPCERDDLGREETINCST
jgi:hypothetical protein